MLRNKITVLFPAAAERGRWSFRYRRVGRRLFDKWAPLRSAWGPASDYSGGNGGGMGYAPTMDQWAVDGSTAHDCERCPVPANQAQHVIATGSEHRRERTQGRFGPFPGDGATSERRWIDFLAECKIVLQNVSERAIVRGRAE